MIKTKERFDTVVASLIEPSSKLKQQRIIEYFDLTKDEQEYLDIFVIQKFRPSYDIYVQFLRLKEHERSAKQELKVVSRRLEELISLRDR